VTVGEEDVVGHARGPAGGPRADRGPLLAALGAPVTEALLEQALTHRSYAYEHGGLPTNERLEFLGDAVLGFVVTEALFREHPHLPEGQLAKLRSAVVNSRALAEVARRLGVGEYVLLGHGEETSGGRDKSSILADTLEAVIGAVYLDSGTGAAAALVHRLFGQLITESAERGAGLDWKTSLQEFAAERDLGAPRYTVTDSGPDHDKWFEARVLVGGRAAGRGTGRSKKEAEQEAAQAAWLELTGEGPEADDGRASSAGADGEPASPAGADGEPASPAGAAGEPASPAGADGEPASPAGAAGEPASSVDGG
jgi:ribonuclease-3